MVLLGKSGSGKSSTGNTILGKQSFKVDLSSESVTKESRRGYRDLEERILTVIDTPGIFDTKTPNTVKNHLEEAIDLAYPGVHVFLLVMKLGVRFSEEEKKTVKNFGEEAQKHTIVLFTHGNVLKEKTMENLLQEHSVVKEIVDSMADYHVFENENKDDETQVSELLKKINKVVDMNEKQMYTREMYNEIQRKRQITKYRGYAEVTARALGVAVLGVAAASAGLPVIAGAVSGGLASIAAAAAAKVGHPVIVGAAAGAAAGATAAIRMGATAQRMREKTTEEKNIIKKEPAEMSSIPACKL